MLLFLQASPPESFIETFNIALTQYTASLQCIVPVFMYLVGIFFSSFFAVVIENIELWWLLLHILCSQVRPFTMAAVLFILHFECLQNKFYIESKLNRDLREDLMKLFADHVAEKHVNTLMREYFICNFELVTNVVTFIWLK